MKNYKIIKTKTRSYAVLTRPAYKVEIKDHRVVKTRIQDVIYKATNKFWSFYSSQEAKNYLDIATLNTGSYGFCDTITIKE